jgi:dethiobiotin synthetase
MAALFITGAGTDIGKTWVTAALARALVAQGRPVEVLKPVVSGFDPAAPRGSDPAVLLAALGRPWSPQALERMSPWRYAAPLSPPLAARREGRELVAAEVFALCRERIAGAEGRLLLIEGAGGAMSPLDDDHTMLDLAVALAVPTLLVAGSYLGAISHALTARLALLSAGVALPAILVSESENAPPLDETLASLARHAAPTPVFAVARGEGLTPEAIAMALGEA